MNAPENKSFDRPTADRVIERAIEIEAARADSLTEAEVRAIAAELSISGAAVEQALAEQRGAVTEARVLVPTPTQPMRWYVRASLTMSVVVVLGLVAVFVSRLFPNG